MIEVKEPKQFLELYNRFVFRNRMFLKSKKTDEMIYFSHPFEDSIIYIRKRKAEEDTKIVEENIQIEEEDEDLFDEYDRYGDDEDDTDNSVVEKNAEVEIVDNSIESKLLRYSIDDMKTWKKYNENDIVNYVVNQKVFICDIFGYFCYELNIFNHSILMAEFKKINLEYEYYYDTEICNDYYTDTEENHLSGVKILPDSDGNIVSKENVKFNAIEFYGENFVNKFMELNSDEIGAYIARDVLKKKEKHLNFLNEFSKEMPTIAMFGTTFYVEDNVEGIADISMYNKLGNACCKEHTCLSWFRENLDELNLPEDESYFDELKKCFEFFGIYLNDYFKYVFHCDKHLQETLELRDAYNAIEFFFDEPLNHPKNQSTFSAYLTEKSKLQFINYFRTLIEDNQKFLEEYEAYKESTGDYTGSFVGGGFGFKGAVKGMLTASVANAIESGIHQAIEFNSMEHKYVVEALKEFAKTQASKDFLLKLMEIDCKLMTYALSAFLNDKIDQLFDRYTGKEEEERFYLINDYYEASKYYSVYLAKKYNLKYIPRYQDENGKKLSSLSNKALLEKAITIFPYETEYYTEYINACDNGNTPLGFVQLMKAFDADEELTNQVEVREEAEKERLLAERQAEKERLEAEQKAREAWEAAEKERLEEERRQREAELQKKYDELASIYGEAYSKHEDIFKPLINNDVFLAFFKKTYSSTTELIKEIDEYIKTKSIISAKLLTNTSPKFKVMLQKAKAAYVKDSFSDDDALIMFDATIFGNAKNGFIITRDAIYSNGLLTDPKKMTFDEIEIVCCDLEGVNAGKKDVKDTSDFISLTGAVGEIGKIVASFIANLYYINEIEGR